MFRRFSEMSTGEIKQAIKELEQDIEKAKAEHWQSKVDMLTRKIEMAHSYMLTPDDFKPGLYHVKNETQLFTLEYINGVMAWGHMEDGNEISLPLAVLTPEHPN